MLRTDVVNLVRQVGGTLDARFLALGLVVPVFETMRRISFSLPLAVATASSAAACVAAVALGFLACACAALAHGMRGGRRDGHRMALSCGALAALSALACAPAACGPAGTGGLAGAAGVTGYALAGACLCLLLLGWVRVLASCKPLACLVHVGSALPLGSLVMPLVVSTDSAPVLLGTVLACLLASCGVLAWICQRPPRDADGATQPTGGIPEEAERPSLREQVARGLDAPAVGLALAMVAWGVMAIPPMPYQTDHKWWVCLVGYCLALAVICGLVFALRENASYGVMRQKMFFLLPVFAVFLAYFSFIRMLDASGGIKNLLSVGYNMSVGGLFVLFVASATARCREKGIAPEYAAAPGLMACALFYGVGALLYEAFGNVAMYFQVVFTTLYILGLAFISMRQASLNDDSRLAERCDAVAGRSGLSQRETEVLQLVVAGYSVPRMAEELSISPETVRTHKKRVYAKLDVHSHEELMRRVRAGK